jgi:hypothetical protein
MSKIDSITILETELSLEEIAAALRIEPEEAERKFRDPRVTSWFAEIWGQKLFNYRAHPNANYPGSDARISLGDIGRFDIAVRCFCDRPIKFQKSKFIGSKRTCTADDLLESIEGVERYVVVDLRGFPKLRFVPLDTKALLRLIREGKLKSSGITPKRFDDWLAESFSVETKQFEL